MKTLRSASALAVIVSFLAPSVVQAIGDKKAAYFGGTYAAFSEAKEPLEGRLDTTNTQALILTVEKKPYAGHVLWIPYSSIEDLEYGQKAGRRVGTAVATTALLGPIGLVSLFSKKRNHYVTIAYKDDTGKDQVAVLELGKDIVRATLPILEARSGKKVTYQDAEAAKAGR
jgi:hypothetical protein